MAINGSYPSDVWWEVDTAATQAWAVAGSPVEAKRQARRIRKMHRQMQIAFPLPISVWAVRAITNGTCRKRIRGPWEQRCRCC